VNALITTSCYALFPIEKKKRSCSQFILVKPVFKQNQIWKEKQM